MGDIRSEMERLRPVYETGVLRLLMRANSQLYVALLRSSFDPLTGELPREVLEERFTGHCRNSSKAVTTRSKTIRRCPMPRIAFLWSFPAKAMATMHGLRIPSTWPRTATCTV